MKTKYLFFLACCAAGCVFVTSALGVTKSIKLESVKTGQLYGPFMVEKDVTAVLADGLYRIQTSEEGKVSFASETSGKVAGAYEVRLGRIVTIGSELYTIVDIGVHESPPPELEPAIPAEPAESVPPAAPAEPVPSTPAVAPAEPAPSTPAVAPAEPAQSAPAVAPAEPAQSAPAVTPAAPRRSPPIVTPVPPAKSSSPVAPAVPARRAPAVVPPAAAKRATPAPTTAPAPRQRVKQPAASPAPARVPPREVLPESMKISPPPGRGYLEGMGFGVDIGVFERIDYSRTLTGGVAASDTAIERNSIAASFRTGRLVLRGGMVLNAEWTDPVSGAGLPFYDADLQNGGGWWAEAEMANPLWRSEAWKLDFTVGGSHRRETYDLSYSVMQTTGSVVIPGTNGAPDTTIPILSPTLNTQDADFTESLLSLGLVLSRGTPVWSMYLGLEAVVLSDSELDAIVSTSTASYEIELDRSGPLSATAGVSVKKGGIHWFSELSVIGEDSLRLGAALVF